MLLCLVCATAAMYGGTHQHVDVGNMLARDRVTTLRLAFASSLDLTSSTKLVIEGVCSYDQRILCA